MLTSSKEELHANINSYNTQQSQLKHNSLKISYLHILSKKSVYLRFR